MTTLSRILIEAEIANVTLNYGTLFDHYSITSHWPAFGVGGLYCFYDGNGQPTYVGKSANLRDRFAEHVSGRSGIHVWFCLKHKSLWCKECPNHVKGVRRYHLAWLRMSESQMDRHEPHAIRQLNPAQNHTFNSAKATPEERETRKEWIADSMAQKRNAEATARAAATEKWLREEQKRKEEQEEERKRQLAALPPLKRWLSKLAEILR
jgi:hypothetical protein